jgi:uncharacterized RDD family membrane protein YckC
MPSTDPYSPPQASLAGLTPSEQADRDNGVLRYGGFWRRAGAYLIDALILLPIVGLDYMLSGETRYYHVFALVPGQLIAYFLYIHMVVKYGGTPGKLALGMRVAALDGAPVNWKQAALRYSVLWALALVMSLMTIAAAMGMSDQEYRSFGYLARSTALTEKAPLIGTCITLMLVWVVACIVSMLANRKRRALHDFIAGTVVVRK